MHFKKHILLGLSVIVSTNVSCAEQQPQKGILSEFFVAKEFGNKQCPLCRGEKEFDTGMVNQQDLKSDAAKESDLKDADAKQRCLYCAHSLKVGDNRTLITWGECGHASHISCVGKPVAAQLKGAIQAIQLPNNEQECPICSEDLNIRSTVIMPCAHITCTKCYVDNPGKECPLCRKASTKRERYVNREPSGPQYTQVQLQMAVNNNIIAPVQEQVPVVVGNLAVQQLPTKSDADKKDNEAKKDQDKKQEAAQDKDWFKCSYCYKVIAPEQIDTAKTSGLCDRFMWNKKLGGDANHYVHEQCVNQMVTEGYCSSCAIDNGQNGYEVRTLSTREEEALAKEIAETKRKAALERRGNSAAMHQFRAQREVVEQDVLARVALRAQQQNALKFNNAPGSGAPGAMQGIKEMPKKVASKTSEEEIAGRLGLSVPEFANQMGMTVDQLKQAIQQKLIQ